MERQIKVEAHKGWIMVFILFFLISWAAVFYLSYKFLSDRISSWVIVIINIVGIVPAIVIGAVVSDIYRRIFGIRTALLVQGNGYVRLEKGHNKTEVNMYHDTYYAKILCSTGEEEEEENDVPPPPDLEIAAPPSQDINIEIIQGKRSLSIAFEPMEPRLRLEELFPDTNFIQTAHGCIRDTGGILIPDNWEGIDLIKHLLKDLWENRHRNVFYQFFSKFPWKKLPQPQYPYYCSSINGVEGLPPWAREYVEEIEISGDSHPDAVFFRRRKDRIWLFISDNYVIHRDKDIISVIPMGKSTRCESCSSASDTSSSSVYLHFKCQKEDGKSIEHNIYDTEFDFNMEYIDSYDTTKIIAQFVNRGLKI